MFKPNKKISIIVDGQTVTGTLTGVDYYVLEDFGGKKCKWPSYTLVSKQKAPFNRYWFVKWQGKNAPWILWTKSKQRLAPKKAKMIFEKSGIAHIKFVGDFGASTPWASLIQYKAGKDKYYCLERFANSKVMYFSGQKIAKPKIVR